MAGWMLAMAGQPRSGKIFLAVRAAAVISQGFLSFESSVVASTAWVS
jgi:hypothetical protein